MNTFETLKDRHRRQICEPIYCRISDQVLAFSEASDLCTHGMHFCCFLITLEEVPEADPFGG